MSSVRGTVPTIKVLLDEAGLDIETRTSTGKTPIMETATYSNVEVLDYLLSRGADLHAIDDEGENSLHIAVRKGSDSIAKILIQRKGRDWHWVRLGAWG